MLGVDAYARKGSARDGKDNVYCRHLVSRLLCLLDSVNGKVEPDPHRPGLYSLFLSRNDELLNPFEEHLLLACATFNMHFNTTTIHCLINHSRQGSCSQLQDKSLARLQEALKETRLLFLDEFSTIGRHSWAASIVV